MAINVDLDNYQYANDELEKTDEHYANAVDCIESVLNNLDYRVLAYVKEDLLDIKASLGSMDTSVEVSQDNLINSQNKIEEIENKASQANDALFSAVSTIGGAAVGTLTGGVVGGIIGGAAGAGIAAYTNSIDSATGAKSSKNQSLIGSFLTSAKNTVCAFFNKVGDVVKDTGAKVANFVTSAASKVAGVIGDIGNFLWTGIKKVGASVANVVIGLVQGLAEFVEAIVDTCAIIVTSAASIFTGLWDLGQWIHGKITGNENWNSATKAMWGGVMDFVGTTHVKDAFRSFYEKTAVGKWLDANAFEWFKSTGAVYQIANGIGYVAGVVILTIVTFGAGGAAVGASSAATSAATTAVTAGQTALIAGTAGFGRGAETAWSQGASLGEGLTYATLNAGWEGLQFYVGAKIGAPGGYGDKVASVLLKEGTSAGTRALVTSGTRVILDAADGGVEGFVQPLLQSVYADGYYDDAGNFVEFTDKDGIFTRAIALFDDMGGWSNVGIQAAIGGGGSLIGEAGDLTRFLKSNGTTKPDLATSAVTVIGGTTLVGSGTLDVDLDPGVKPPTIKPADVITDTVSDVKVDVDTGTPSLDVDTKVDVDTTKVDTDIIADTETSKVEIDTASTDSGKTGIDTDPKVEVDTTKVDTDPVPDTETSKVEIDKTQVDSESSTIDTDAKTEVDTKVDSDLTPDAETSKVEVDSDKVETKVIDETDTTIKSTDDTLSAETKTKEVDQIEEGIGETTETKTPSNGEGKETKVNVDENTSKTEVIEEKVITETERIAALEQETKVKVEELRRLYETDISNMTDRELQILERNIEATKKSIVNSGLTTDQLSRIIPIDQQIATNMIMFSDDLLTRLRQNIDLTDSTRYPPYVANILKESLSTGIFSQTSLSYILDVDSRHAFNTLLKCKDILSDADYLSLTQKMMSQSTITPDGHIHMVSNPTYTGRYSAMALETSIINNLNNPTLHDQTLKQLKSYIDGTLSIEETFSLLSNDLLRFYDYNQPSAYNRLYNSIIKAYNNGQTAIALHNMEVLSYMMNKGNIKFELVPGQAYACPTVYALDSLVDSDGTAYHEFGHVMHILNFGDSIPANGENLLLTAQQNAVKNSGKLNQYLRSLSDDMRLREANASSFYDQWIKDNYGSVRAYKKALKDYYKNIDIEAIIKEFGISDSTAQIIRNGGFTLDQIVDTIYSTNRKAYIEQASRESLSCPVSDIIAAVFKDRNVDIGNQHLDITYAHGADYWNETTFNSYTEIIANYNQLLMLGDYGSINLLREILGDEFMNAIDEIYRGTY